MVHPLERSIGGRQVRSLVIFRRGIVLWPSTRPGFVRSISARRRDEGCRRVGVSCGNFRDSENGIRRPVSPLPAAIKGVRTASMCVKVAEDDTW